MKLYTEEQVREAFNMGSWNKYEFEYVIKSLTPIELPSDEGIEDYANFAFPDAEKIGGETYSAYRGMKVGAKWMKEQILNQNK